MATVTERLGYRAGVIDTGANSSAGEWRELHGRSDIPVRSCVETSLAEDVARARRGGIQILVVDTGPRIDAHLAAAIREADFVLVPTRPAQPDVTRTRRRVDLVRTPGKRFGVLINVAPPRRGEADALLVGSARAALTEYGARLFRGQITQRHAVIWAMAAGRGVVETEPVGPASREYQAAFATIMRGPRREISVSRQRTLSEPRSETRRACDSFGDGPDPAAEALDGRRGVLVRMSPDARKALRQLALDEDTSVQALMIAAVNELFARRGRLPIA